MYIHIGFGILVSLKDIVAILNLQEPDLALPTKEFLEIALSEKRVKGCSRSDAKSCIITYQEVYYSNISSSTLLKRSLL